MPTLTQIAKRQLTLTTHRLHTMPVLVLTARDSLPASALFGAYQALDSQAGRLPPLRNGGRLS